MCEKDIYGNKQTNERLVANLLQLVMYKELKPKTKQKRTHYDRNV